MKVDENLRRSPLAQSDKIGAPAYFKMSPEYETKKLEDCKTERRQEHVEKYGFDQETIREEVERVVYAQNIPLQRMFEIDSINYNFGNSMACIFEKIQNENSSKRGISKRGQYLSRRMANKVLVGLSKDEALEKQQIEEEELKYKHDLERENQKVEEAKQEAIQDAVADAVSKWHENAKQLEAARLKTETYEEVSPSNLTMEKYRSNLSSPAIKTYSVDVELDQIKNLSSLLTKNIKKMVKDNDIFFKAAVVAMQEVPCANAKWIDNRIRIYKKVNANIACHCENKTTFTPLIKDVTSKGLKELVKIMRSFESSAARNLTEEIDCHSSIFTFHTFEKINVKSLIPSLQNNQACLLSIGTPEMRAIPNDDVESEDKYIISKVVTATLVCDDRILNESRASELIENFKYNVENPVKIFL
eukprot:CAMPEP_0194314134 /NCGR_PEP_ID=MMETSP0171-20130528/10957_1 /TAXON_ID=218684 /ORGANISM="Corethron pennatum, Strain L29A3" /LENGTH=416 /DNA_ID=CAMNT_0039069391 /DNA_START=149 /DNA_END=1402 /DNA_ORIENTATION=-